MDEYNPCVGGIFIGGLVEKRRVHLIEKIYNLYTKTDCKPERENCKRRLEGFGFTFPYKIGDTEMWDIMSHVNDKK